ncbi:NF038129 family PEP-CTERM protein [Massilia putida]|uniref:NF038129 family PEP-CTERM protein n=1 Tax=Massilia putida TaxID=1141883 RepID=UPI001474FCA2|nr:NF038129 family PEP-CTERM protein [Massilia putida]
MPSGSAHAVPFVATPMAQYHHVDIGTSALGTGTAYLGLDFLGVGGATPASATVGNLAGALLGSAAATESVTVGPAGALTFTSAAGGGDWYEAIQLGGRFGFDVGFLSGARRRQHVQLVAVRRHALSAWTATWAPSTCIPTRRRTVA